MNRQFFNREPSKYYVIENFLVFCLHALLYSLWIVVRKLFIYQHPHWQSGHWRSLPINEDHCLVLYPSLSLISYNFSSFVNKDLFFSAKQRSTKLSQILITIGRQSDYAFFVLFHSVKRVCVFSLADLPGFVSCIWHGRKMRTTSNDARTVNPSITQRGMSCVFFACGKCLAWSVIFLFFSFSCNN